MPYRIEDHSHRFAAWAAGRAASVKGCRFSVEQGREILEATGLTADFSMPDRWLAPRDFDDQHRLWRGVAIEAAKSRGLKFSHGVAAKLINVYLKSRFVCGGHHAHERAHNLHPPIDDVLLKALVECEVERAKEWRQVRRTRWSKLDSEQYEQVIKMIRQSLKGEPLWKIEEHWPGNQ